MQRGNGRADISRGMNHVRTDNQIERRRSEALRCSIALEVKYPIRHPAAVREAVARFRKKECRRIGEDVLARAVGNGIQHGGGRAAGAAANFQNLQCTCFRARGDECRDRVAHQRVECSRERRIAIDPVHFVERTIREEQRERIFRANQRRTEFLAAAREQIEFAGKWCTVTGA